MERAPLPKMGHTGHMSEVRVATALALRCTGSTGVGIGVAYSYKAVRSTVLPAYVGVACDNKCCQRSDVRL